MVTVRRATVQDALGIGRVHVRAWQAAYRGQMPDDYLDGLGQEEQAAGWARGIDDDRHPILVAERAGRVVGFAVVGTAKVPEGDLGELYELDVDPDHWGTGVGRALLAAAHGELARLGHREAVLWVLPGNDRARRFYEVAGWTDDGVRRTSDVRGIVVPAVRYRLRLQQPPSKP